MVKSGGEPRGSTGLSIGVGAPANDVDAWKGRRIPHGSSGPSAFLSGTRRLARALLGRTSILPPVDGSVRLVTRRRSASVGKAALCRGRPFFR